MGISAGLKPRGELNLPSTKTSDIRGWCWHRQECQLVWFIGRHGGCGEWVRNLVSRVTWFLRLSSQIFLRVYYGASRLNASPDL